MAGSESALNREEVETGADPQCFGQQQFRVHWSRGCRELRHVTSWKVHSTYTVRYYHNGGKGYDQRMAGRSAEIDEIFQPMTWTSSRNHDAPPCRYIQT